MKQWLLMTLCLLVGFCVGMSGGIAVGMRGYQAYKLESANWTDRWLTWTAEYDQAAHKDLVQRGFAEYNRKTGAWQYREIKDIVAENTPVDHDADLLPPVDLGPPLPKKKESRK